MIRTIPGRKAAPGVATGRPVIVRSVADLVKVKAGDILVAAQTDIDYVSGMYRASAVITETGGRFCHAAVWARENCKPTLLQVIDATTLLEGVRLVTVDAEAGTVTWEEQL
jgi:pyruvate,water dikinase